MKASTIKAVSMGVAGDTSIYARGVSYFTNDAAVCANGNLMQQHYSGRIKSTHRVILPAIDARNEK